MKTNLSDGLTAEIIDRRYDDSMLMERPFDPSPGPGGLYIYNQEGSLAFVLTHRQARRLQSLLELSEQKAKLVDQCRGRGCSPALHDPAFTSDRG